jgi:hypothetical protein
VSEQPGRDRYRLKTLLLEFHSFSSSAPFCRGVPGTLDEISFLLPQGFLAQGLLIGMVALAFWSTRMQELFDRRLNEGEDL